MEIKGKRFGRLVAIDRTDDYISPHGLHSAVWRCKCDCGNTIDVRESRLIEGQQSCGCIQREKWMINRFDEILPTAKLLELYIDKKWSLRKLQEEYGIQRKVIKTKLIQLGVTIRQAHSKEYYPYRRKYETWQTGSRNYNRYMERYLGRSLLKDEVVHHIDFDRNNNSIDNLFVFENNTLHGAYHGYLKVHDYITPSEFVDKYANIYKECLTYDNLFSEYIIKNKSVSQISRENEPISRSVITKRLKEYNITKENENG